MRTTPAGAIATNGGQAQFGIVQGSVFQGQRDESAAGMDLSNRQLLPPAGNLAPYPYVFTLIQIKIRAYEPDTKQVREMTVVHEFLQE